MQQVFPVQTNLYWFDEWIVQGINDKKTISMQNCGMAPVKIIKNNLPCFQLVIEDLILNLCLCICVWLIIGFRNLVT